MQQADIRTDSQDRAHLGRVSDALEVHVVDVGQGDDEEGRLGEAHQAVGGGQDEHHLLAVVPLEAWGGGGGGGGSGGRDVG